MKNLAYKTIEAENSSKVLKRSVASGAGVPTPLSAVQAWPTVEVILAIVLLALFTGCTAPWRSNHPFTPAYKPKNVFVWGSSLPPHIRRVACLPMACDNDTQLSDGRDTLEPVFRDELAKTRLFETV